MKLFKIYSIILFSRKKRKGVCIFILSKKTKYYTKEFFRVTRIATLALIIIIAIILIKYRPVYKVTVSGNEMGYVKNKDEFNQMIKAKILEPTESNVVFVELGAEPEYEFKFANVKDTDEEKILLSLQESSKATYQVYAITLNGQNRGYVNTQEEADKVVDEIKEQYSNDLELDIAVVVNYIDNIDSINSTEVVVAKTNLQTNLDEQIRIKQEEEVKAKAEEEQKNIQMASTTKASSTSTVTARGSKSVTTERKASGKIIAVRPVSGKITSRFGNVSKIRSGAHTGLDIATSAGTAISSCNSGTVKFAGRKGSYGNLVIVSHGNGVETWYAHCSKLYVSAGKSVSAGQKIAAVGSTGNSTGPHLHLEIRINGTPVNPEKYL